MAETTTSEVLTGECRWNCPNMNKAVRFTGQDAVAIYTLCNRIFEVVSNAQVEKPDCAIVYAEENGDRRYTHAS